jgi:hypothetical protein
MSLLKYTNIFDFMRVFESRHVKYFDVSVLLPLWTDSRKPPGCCQSLRQAHICVCVCVCVATELKGEIVIVYTSHGILWR